MFHGDLRRSRCRTVGGCLRRANDALAGATYWQRLAAEGSGDSAQRVRDLMSARVMLGYARKHLAAAKGLK